MKASKLDLGCVAEWGGPGMFMLKGLGDLADFGCLTIMIDMYRQDHTGTFTV